jgi:hypothetical protein
MLLYFSQSKRKTLVPLQLLDCLSPTTMPFNEALVKKQTKVSLLTIDKQDSCMMERIVEERRQHVVLGTQISLLLKYNGYRKFVWTFESTSPRYQRLFDFHGKMLLNF